jgi:hypothetical protein
LTVPGGSIFNSIYSTDISCYTNLATDSSIITAMITTGNVRTANITTGNIHTANITQANIIIGVIYNVSTGNLHVNGNLGINNVSGACKINVSDSSTNNTV